MGDRNGKYGRRPGSFGTETRVDGVHRLLWTIQISCFVISALVLFATIIAASIRVEGGFPCFFGSVVDYKTTNETAIRIGLTTPQLGGVVPVLFLETWSVTFFFYAVSIVALILACYFIAGAALVNKTVDDAVDSGGSAYVTSLVASSSTVLMGTVMLWLVQATIVVLAYKLIVLAAAVYMVHFGLLSLFFGYFCGRGVDSSTYEDDVSIAKRISGPIHRLVGNWRALMTNLIGGIYGMSIVMVCLMFGMLLANSFTTRFWHIIVIALITTSVLTLIYLLVLELLAARYVHMLIGPYVGLLIGYGMLGSATNDYTNRFYYAMGANGSNLRMACQIVLGIFAALILIAMLTRIIRASMYHRRRFTRAYVTAKKLRGAVKDRAVRLIKRRGGDRAPLRPELPVTSDGYGTSEDDVIYENVEMTGETDSEWDD